MTQQLEENDVVLCTVKRIEGTTVFLEVEGNGQGTMIFSEVSPGRIRNIREFVVPNKKIVCKILRIKDGHPELSLRRVTAKEREELMERYKKERAFTSMIKPILKEKTQEIIDSIKATYDIADFLDEARENPTLIEQFVTKKESEELTRILATAKETKAKTVKTKVTLTTQSPSGLEDIKKTLNISEENTEINYLGSSKFAVTVKAPDYKTANVKLEEILEIIKTNAKKHNVTLTVKESKK